MFVNARSIFGVLAVVAVTSLFQLMTNRIAIGVAVREFWALFGWILTPVLAGSLCTAAYRGSRGTDRYAWGSLAAGCLLWAVGTICWRADPEFPGPGDAAYLFSCLFFVTGLFRYTVGNRSISLVKLSDFAIAASAAALALIIAFQEQLEASALTGFAKTVAFLYPVSWFAAAAFGLTCLALHASSWRRPATRLLVIAATLHAIADLFYGLSIMAGSGWRLFSPHHGLP
jgi:hypothetical protein